MDDDGENITKKVDQEEVTQSVRKSTCHVSPIHRLEPTTRGKTYQTNHLITQTVEEI